MRTHGLWPLVKSKGYEPAVIYPPLTAATAKTTAATAKTTAANTTVDASTMDNAAEPSPPSLSLEGQDPARCPPSGSLRPDATLSVEGTEQGDMGMSPRSEDSSVRAALFRGPVSRSTTRRWP
ncbi:hypothetical protein BGZ70_000081 [Mortierella alpina]|uniref:Uncharacterized protein n=1 Tax=Mortierella alpina TaxID=64518 RepID=A0A9P6M616_MORAP|nr:hypothetical protein BGZ70_000081 [Mortierella alpina]